MTRRGPPRPTRPPAAARGGRRACALGCALGCALAVSAAPRVARAQGGRDVAAIARTPLASLPSPAQPAGQPAAQPAGQPVALPPRIGAAARAAIERLADSARAAGAPAAPLYAKAAEGVLKGADDARIVVAVRRLAGELTAARLALGAGAAEGDVVAAASALHAGVPAAALQRLRAAHGARGALALPFVVLADLASRGVPAPEAVDAVDRLLARGVPEAELSAFRAGVERDLLAGRDAQAALGARTRSALQRADERATPPSPARGGRVAPPAGGVSDAARGIRSP